MRMRDAAKRRLLGAGTHRMGLATPRALLEAGTEVYLERHQREKPTSTDPRGCEAKPQITRTRTELPDQMFRSQLQTKELVT